MFTVFHPIEHVYGITGILSSEINHYFSPGGFKNINCILCLFDDSGNILSYEQFMSYHSFPTPPKNIIK